MRAAAAGRLAAAVAVARAHPRHLVLFALVAGLLASRAHWVVAVAVVASALPAAGRRTLGLVAAAAVLGGCLLAQERVQALERGPLQALTATVLDGRAVLLEPPRPRPHGGAAARVRWLDGPARGDVAVARLPPARSPAAPSPAVAARVAEEAAADSHGAGSSWPSTGAVLRLRGRVVALGSWEEFQQRRGAHAAFEVTRAVVTGERRGGAAGVLDAARDRATSGLARTLPATEAGVLRGMVLGDESGIPDEVRRDFERSGLAHLLAVSGQNVMLLAALVLAAGALVGAPLRARLGIALVVVVLYVPLTGAGPSIQRAGVMGAAGLVAALAGRPAARWYALELAAAVTLIANPRAVEEVGWQLSFAAVVALLAGAAPLSALLRRARIPGALSDVVAITTLATLATGPLLAHHFGELSLVSLPANILAAPAVAPVMWLGMLSAALAQADVALAAPTATLAGPFVAFVEWVAHVAAAAPQATASVRLGSPWSVVAAYLGLGVAVAAGVHLVRRWRDRALSSGRRFPAAGAIVAASVVALLAGAGWRLAHRPLTPPPAADELVVSFLDVGQGDATLLQTATSAVLFDTGPPDGPILDRLREAGVRRLDVLVITHAQADHEGAAPAVLRRLRPRLVLNGGAGGTSAVQRMLPSLATAAGARVSAAAAGRSIRLGALELRLLWPPPAVPAAGGDPNDRAVVAHVRHGSFDLLLPADAESHVLAPLDLPRVEALKVSHHGSDDPGLAMLLERLRPAVAAIEVGRDNDYGHPTRSTLAALRAVPQVGRTDLDGTIRLRARDGRMTFER